MEMMEIKRKNSTVSFSQSCSGRLKDFNLFSTRQATYFDINAKYTGNKTNRPYYKQVT